MAENKLLDTNVLVYAYDVSEKRRRGIVEKQGRSYGKT